MHDSWSERLDRAEEKWIAGRGEPVPFGWQSGQPLERLDPLWWTDADAAELDLLIAEMCRGLDLHQEKHGRYCRCDIATRIIEPILEWRSWRILKSKAQMLRALRGL